MLLTKSRIPILATGIILLFGFVLFLMAERASAHDSETPFGDTVTDLSWGWVFDGDSVNVCFAPGRPMDGWRPGRGPRHRDLCGPYRY